MKIVLENIVLRNPVFQFREPINLTIEKGEQIAVVGKNGSGKSVLAKIISGSLPLKSGKAEYSFYPKPVYKNIRFIAFKDSYGSADTSYYMQQRWNSQDKEESPVVRDCLKPLLSDSTLLADKNSFEKRFFDLFAIDEMLDKQMALLSSGEMRKFQLTKALLSHPGMLIIDNPFIGLDAQTRELLADLLSSLASEERIQFILLLAKSDEIPAFITHVVPIEDMICGQKVRREDFKATFDVKLKKIDFPFLSKNNNNSLSEDIIVMKNVSIRYDERTILKSLDWIVKKGEKWVLLGRNGSGKSTLLSLVCADNPQSYACDISLFGNRRGTGESIWDIKKRIGYVSPEMHRSYSENIQAIKIVASGLNDSIGLYVQPRPEQYDICEKWMNVFGISHLKDRLFLQMSDGEQRLVLLARAFVKDPELVVLDEPLHGLDMQNRIHVFSIINSYCQSSNKTLILVTHYENEIPQCITKRLVLQKNK